MKTGVFSRRPIFWILLSSIFVGGLLFALKYFSSAFPIVNIDIQMSRPEALADARISAEQYAWGPANFEQTISFSVDEETKNFIELEGGGKKVLNNILKEKFYSLYTWNIRHFKQLETNETLIKFTPEGRIYGFTEKIAETTSGAALSSKEAQKIAEATAIKGWNVDFAQYQLVESSDETKPSGRIDHTFIYEYLPEKVGDAPYRLRLVISGDKLTTFNLFLKVPEAFTRRYQQMRSTNNTIASVASIIMILLYFFGGCILGLFFLMRRRAVIWSKPFIWSSFIGLLLTLTSLNQLPSLWMTYDTAIVKSTFYINFLLSLLGIFSAITFIFGIIFAAAESLTREAFPEQIQLWKIWSKKGATSIQVLGRTIGGYLILGFDFAFIISIYYFASRYFDWWTPSSTLIDPNIIATYAPWLGAVGQSLSAGFMEECLFRAVPLAGAAFIGKRYGNAKAWIFAAFILQAIIFGAAHANYPSQPAYARLVELIIPSFVFGGIYLAFGLLPAIISHFTYDVVWFSLPIFLSSVNDMWLSQCLVILLTLIPVWIVLFARLRSGYWSEISRNLYNKAWQPKEKPIFEPIIKQPVEFITEKLRYRNWLFIAGIIGLIVWLFAAPFAHNGINLKIDKQTAKTEANETLAQKNITLSDPWQQFAFVQAQINEQHKFLWRTNQSLYKKLLGNYLMPAQWQVRYAQFEGNIVERAEEYNVFVNPDGSVVRISHQLPESKAGQSLSESEARTLAYKTIKDQFGLEAKQLIEISAVSYKKPERLDWVFTFKDPLTYPKDADSNEYGEARINIEITGDTIADYYRYIFVPEEWKRIEKQDQTVFSILMSICLLVLAILFISCGLRAINQWIHHQFAQKTFFIIFFLLLGKSVIQFWNLFPIFIATFKTSEPYNNQLITLAGSLFIRVLFTSLGLALIFGFVQTATFFLQRIRDIYERVLFGGIAGIIISGFFELAEKLSPSLSPLWPSYLHASARFPSISFALTHFTAYITTTLTFYLLFKTLDYLSQSWSKNLWQTTVLSLILGIAYKGSTGIEHINTWLLFGSLFGIVLLELYIHLIRFDRTIIPYLAAVISISEIIQETAFGAYQGIYLGTLFAITIISIFSIWWSEQLYQTKE